MHSPQATNGTTSSPVSSDAPVEEEDSLFISFDLDVGTTEDHAAAPATTDIPQPPAEPPWARAAAAADMDSHLLQLHNGACTCAKHIHTTFLLTVTPPHHTELVALYAYLTPTSEEHAARQRTVQRTAQVVQSIWPSSTVSVFGSFATGLYLPTSDIDLVVLGSDAADNLVNAQRALAAALARQGVGKNITVREEVHVCLHGVCANACVYIQHKRMCPYHHTATQT